MSWPSAAPGLCPAGSGIITHPVESNLITERGHDTWQKASGEAPVGPGAEISPTFVFLNQMDVDFHSNNQDKQINFTLLNK